MWSSSTTACPASTASRPSAKPRQPALLAPSSCSAATTTKPSLRWPSRQGLPPTSANTSRTPSCFQQSGRRLPSGPEGSTRHELLTAMQPPPTSHLETERTTNVLKYLSPEHLARFSARRPWLILALWVVLIAGSVGGMAMMKIDDSGSDSPNAESARAATALEESR